MRDGNGGGVWKTAATGWARGLAFLTPERRGLAGVLLVAGSLGLLHVLMIPKFRAADEPRHVAYALALAEGTWPEVTDPLPLERLGVEKIMDRGVYIAAANHPPLYYWTVGLPLKLAADRGELVRGLRIARLLTLAIALAALVYVFRIAKLLVPGRPAVALGATLLTGIVPTYLNTSGIVYNDALGVLTTVAALEGGLSVLVLGPTRGRLVATGVWSALALFTRITGALVVGPAILAASLGVYAHADGPAARRLLRAAAAGAALGLAVLVVSGWFYLRNYRLYGDVTASSALLKLFHRKPKGTTLELLATPRLWASMPDLFWMRLAGHVHLKSALTPLVSIASGAAVLLASKAAFHWAKLGPLAARLHAPRTWALGISVLAFGCVVVPMFAFHARGGSFNMRYGLAVLWLPALLLAVGLAAFRSALPGQVLTVVLVGASAYAHELYGQALLGRAKAATTGIEGALAAAGVSQPSLWFVVTALGVGAGTALYLAATASLHRRFDEPAPVPP